MFKNISFNIPNSYGTFIFEIIKNCDLVNYFFVFENYDYIEQNIEQNNNFVFNKIYSINDINTNANQYVMFLKLLLYPEKNIAYKSYVINNIDDFLKSQCSSIIFVTDSTIVNILSKNNDIVEQIELYAKKCSYKNIEISNDFLKHNIFDYF